MKKPALKLIAELRVQASAIGLEIARLPDGDPSPAVAAAEQALRKCIKKLGGVRTALATKGPEPDDDDTA